MRRVQESSTPMQAANARRSSCVLAVARVLLCTPCQRAADLPKKVVESSPVCPSRVQPGAQRPKRATSDFFRFPKAGKRLARITVSYLGLGKLLAGSESHFPIQSV
eukprot:1928920-Prymnesium_polylepis.3